jgi:hypothetical protein
MYKYKASCYKANSYTTTHSQYNIHKAERREMESLCWLLDSPLLSIPSIYYTVRNSMKSGCSRPFNVQLWPSQYPFRRECGDCTKSQPPPGHLPYHDRSNRQLPPSHTASLQRMNLQPPPRQETVSSQSLYSQAPRGQFFWLQDVGIRLNSNAAFACNM